MQILNRNIRLKHLSGTIEEINLVGNRLGLTTDIIIKSTTNWLFHVDIELSIIVEGNDEMIKQFDELIN